MKSVIKNAGEVLLTSSSNQLFICQNHDFVVVWDHFLGLMKYNINNAGPRLQAE